MVDCPELDESFARVETVAPRDPWPDAEEAQVRQRQGVTVVCVEPTGGGCARATAGPSPALPELAMVARSCRHPERVARVL